MTVRSIVAGSVLFLLVAAWLPWAVAHERHTLRGKVTPEERAAFRRAEPVFAKYCYSCHASKGGHRRLKALAHLGMDRYPFTGHHAGEAGAAIREVLGATGKTPTMPDDDPGVVRGPDLQLVLDWAQAFDRAHAADEATR